MELGETDGADGVNAWSAGGETDGANGVNAWSARGERTVCTR